MVAVFQNGILYGLTTVKEVDKMYDEAKFAGAYIVMTHVNSLKELQRTIGREFNAFELKNE